MEDDAIRALLKRLARPHVSGGVVIERAAILAEGAHFTEIMTWVMAHGGKAEEAIPAPSAGGLHGSRITDGASPDARTPLRFILPPGTLA
jgi:hypothetical protein